MNPDKLLLSLMACAALGLAGCGSGEGPNAGVNTDSSGNDTSDNDNSDNVDSDSSSDSGSDDENNQAGADCQLSTLQQRLLMAHNQARSVNRQCGDISYPAATALTWNCKLEAAAEGHNQDMVSNNFFSHTGSDGLSPSHRVTNAGYQWQVVAENIAAGQSSVNSVVDAWLASPGHCTNIMNGSLREIGGAMLQTSSADYGYYWTVNFGTPR